MPSGPCGCGLEKAPGPLAAVRGPCFPTLLVRTQYRRREWGPLFKISKNFKMAAAEHPVGATLCSGLAYHLSCLFCALCAVFSSYRNLVIFANLPSAPRKW